MKKTSTLLFLFSLIGLTVFSFKVEKVQEAQLQLGYQQYVSDKSGLSLTIFDNLHFNGFPKTQEVVSTFDLRNLDYAPFQQAPFSAYVRGFLKVPKSGTYSLECASDDGALVSLDGKRVINNWGFHPYKSKKEKIYLTKGWHYLEVKYRNEVGAAGLKVAWSPLGKKRAPLAGEDIFLPKNLLPLESPFPGLLSEELILLNQMRGGLFLLALMCVVFFFCGKRIKTYFQFKEAWVALGVFVLAFSLRWVYYAQHLYLRIQGIMDGGDNFSFLTLPFNYVTSGDFISLKCGNLPLLIPLLGTLYKYFGFFPGLHYYALLMILLGSFVCLFPWMLLRSQASSWVGLMAGFFLALTPLLVEFKTPYVSSDPLGFFTFSMALILSLKALQDNRISSYLFAGFALALLPLSRTVYIPSAPLFALALFFLSKEKKRAWVALAMFAFVVLGYEYLAQPILGQSYFLYFFRDGFGATMVHRASDQPKDFWSMLFWLPRFLENYFRLIYAQMLPSILNWSFLRWLLVGLLGFSLAYGLKRKPRSFIFIGIVLGIYLFEIASYHVHARLTLPVIFVIGLILALGNSIGVKPLSVKRRKLILSIVIPVMFVFGFWQVGSQAVQLAQKGKNQKNYLKWVCDEAPEKSILLTDSFIDPWGLHQQTKLPVFYDVTLDQTLVVQRQVVPISRVTFLADQSQLPRFIYVQSQMANFRHHPYVLDGVHQQGYRYLIVQEKLAHSLKQVYFKDNQGMSLNPKHYRLEKIADYPENPVKGIWELKRTKEPIDYGLDWEPPKHPADLDRFLQRT